MFLLISKEKSKEREKTETIAEFLARGGSIKIIPANAPNVKPDTVKSTTNNGGAVVMLSMEEADLYHGEFKPRKPKKAASTIDLSALPEALRKKYVDEVLSASEEDEEEDSD